MRENTNNFPKTTWRNHHWRTKDLTMTNTTNPKELTNIINHKELTYITNNKELTYQ